MERDEAGTASESVENGTGGTNPAPERTVAPAPVPSGHEGAKELAELKGLLSVTNKRMTELMEAFNTHVHQPVEIVHQAEHAPAAAAEEAEEAGAAPAAPAEPPAPAEAPAAPPIKKRRWM